MLLLSRGFTFCYLDVHYILPACLQSVYKIDWFPLLKNTFILMKKEKRFHTVSDPSMRWQHCHVVNLLCWLWEVHWSVKKGNPRVFWTLIFQDQSVKSLYSYYRATFGPHNICHCYNCNKNMTPRWIYQGSVQHSSVSTLL